MGKFDRVVSRCAARNSAAQLRRAQLCAVLSDAARPAAGARAALLPPPLRPLPNLTMSEAPRDAAHCRLRLARRRLARAGKGRGGRAVDRARHRLCRRRRRVEPVLRASQFAQFCAILRNYSDCPPPFRRSTVDAWAMTQPKPEEVFVWLEPPCTDLHRPTEAGPLWWGSVFKGGVKEIGRTLLLLDPWENAGAAASWSLPPPLPRVEGHRAEMTMSDERPTDCRRRSSTT